MGEPTDIKALIHSKNTQLSKYEHEIAVLNEKLKAAHEENRLLGERLAEMDISRNIKLIDLRRETELLTSEKHALLSENEALLEEISRRQHESSELRREVEIKNLQLDEAGGQLTRRLKEAESEITALKEGFSAEINRIGEKLKDAEHLRVEKSALENALRAALSKHSGIEGEKQLLESKLKEAESEITALKEGFSAEINRINEKLKEAERLYAEKSALEMQVFQAQEKISSLEDALGQREQEPASSAESTPSEGEKPEEQSLSKAGAEVFAELPPPSIPELKPASYVYMGSRGMTFKKKLVVAVILTALILSAVFLKKIFLF